MADRAVALRIAALGVALLLAALTLGSAIIVAARATSWTLGPADGAALRFTLLQAALSAGLSALLAVPVARALMRRRFLGRGVLIRLMAAPFVLPVVVAVLGLLAVFGRAGPVNGALAALGLPALSIFGLHGVVLAHVFLNLPLAVRIILMGWQAIPAERLRLAQSLGFSDRAMFRHIELPMLRAVLPGAGAVIFLLCLTSFAVALTLGGGPKSSTLELAIFQALRFDFDLGRAALLAALQFALCAAVTVATARVASPFGFGAGLDRAVLPFAPRGWRAALDAVAIAAAALLLLAPLLAVVVRGVPGLLDLPSGVWPAALRSVLVALASAALAVAAVLPLAASGLVMGVGLFLVIHPVARPESLALPVTVLVNATLSLPYLFRLLLPQARQVVADYGRLSASLGMGARARLRWVILPRLSRPLGYGAGLAAALSMGDLGVIALFAGDQGATLPLMVQRLMGAYRMEQAAGAALLLVSLSFVVFWLFDRIGDRNADA